MNPAQRLKELLDELAPLLGQESLPIDENGICTLMVDGSLALNLAATDDMLTLFAPLGEVPAERKPALLEQMLRANGAGNALFVLGLARNTDTALISARRPWNGLDVQVLEQWAGAFVDTAMQWRATLAQSSGNPPDASPATGWLQA